MPDRDPDFFKMHYRQWRQRMHKLRVPYDLQGALLSIVIETHLTGSPPADDDFVLAGCLMVSPRKARAVVNRLSTIGLVCIKDGLVIDKTAVEDMDERSQLRATRAEAGRKGGVRSGVVRCDSATLSTPSGGFASNKPLKHNETDEAHSQTTFELEKRREEKKEKRDTKVSPKNPTISASSFPDTVHPEKAQDYLDFRKAKRSPVTSGVMKTITQALTEIHTEGIDVNKALDLAMSRNWQGFRAEWVRMALKPQKANGHDKSSRTADFIKMAGGGSKRTACNPGVDNGDGVGGDTSAGVLSEQHGPGSGAPDSGLVAPRAGGRARGRA